MIIWGNDSSPKDNRPQDIVNMLRSLNLLPTFSIVDIACGTGRDILEVKESFPDCNALGIDVLSFPEWAKLPFKKMPLQDFIKMPSKWDVVLMLNSYRNWEGSERVAFDTWLKTHSTYFIWDDADRKLNLVTL